MDGPDDSLLMRWSRRKHAARQAKHAEPEPPRAAEPVPAEGETAPAEPAAANAVPGTEKTESKEPAAEVRVEDLPDINTMTYESDFSVFLREGVPELIKRQALRKLWTTDPVLANLDGLNDYDPKSMTFLIQDMEGSAEAVAEVGRGLRDKIMEAKRARDDRPGGPRRRRPPHARPGAPPPARTDVAEQRPESEKSRTETPSDAPPSDADKRGDA